MSYVTSQARKQDQLDLKKLKNKIKNAVMTMGGEILTRWATALRFSGNIFNSFCFAGSYTPTKIAEALHERTGSIETAIKYP